MSRTTTTRRAVLAALVPAVIAACSGSRRSNGEAATTTSDLRSTSATTATATTATTAVVSTAGPTTSTQNVESTVATTVANSAEVSTTAPPTVVGYFPPATGPWDTARPDDAGWSSAGLERVVDLVSAANSTTFMMLSGGRVLTEQYFGSATAESVQDIASCQKSITSTLLGIARDRGLLSFADTVSTYLPAGWSNAQPADEARITVYHLMTMSSGLSPRNLRKDVEPGTKFVYNTDAYQKLRRVLEVAAGLDINSISRAWLFDGVGMDESAVWVERPQAASTTDAVGDHAWGLRLTARNMCRFGLFAQRSGSWDGLALTTAGWFAEAWTPSPTAGDYGLLWWLVGRGRLRGVGAPVDWVAALGAQDQKIYVVPSLDLVVARQGAAAKESSDAQSNFDQQLATAILAARA